ncbi:hypothetical protein [Phormidium sp. FACHB-1136]|jgi:hypothetical protein|uniref:hypothetical protein n=1 Tax=Phormidium sp. FACHB-1136 TaxID=2692848 RepID=UPI001685FAFC|nr:hypothetical protein [Phormidium sp. FACHB-1136]MBD2427349.1 hypothetical protein [Phormidium sp. FACHB-1136]
MTGFIRGLFGGKAKNPGEADRPAKANPQPSIESSGSAYFLEPDDAKSFGNIEYMRSSKTVRRTFAKKRGETEEKESIRKISATEAVKLDESGLPKAKSIPTESTTSSTSSSSFTSRNLKTDTNLDMFRKMAKDIKK